MVPYLGSEGLGLNKNCPWINGKIKTFLNENY